jgi:hypothetical protein
MDSCLHNILYQYICCKPFGFDLAYREMLPQPDKQFHKERGYSVDTLLVGKLHPDSQQGFQCTFNTKSYFRKFRNAIPLLTFVNFNFLFVE